MIGPSRLVFGPGPSGRPIALSSTSPCAALLDKVATRPAQVTDADFATAMDAGFTDDQLFELVICAAVGQSTRQYEAGLAALGEATADT